MSRMSWLTRTDQNRLSLALASLWKPMPELTGLSCRSKAVVLTDFCSSPVSRARLSVKVSAIRKSMGSGHSCLEPNQLARFRDALSPFDLQGFAERRIGVQAARPPDDIRVSGRRL